jgi:hypothetical protein
LYGKSVSEIKLVLRKIFDNITNKIFKVVADQAANMKKALENETESTAISGGANSDNIVALTKLLIERRRKLDNIEEKKQTLLVSEINK